ncbi:signal peptidase I [Olleya namhaensis]|uniref:signal peptidase I n=1 Tax=Olleya namhaensis TaxID=1144750 RepID=UPI0024910972|nr:signal peptidase I [Olleya namhaensis]
MDVTQWIIFFLVIQVLHGLATWKLYKKADRQAWEAFVPVYNAVILMKIINRPWWWTILLFLPIVNLILFPVVWVEIARSYGKNSALDTFLAIFTFGFYSFYLNYVATDVTHKKDRDLQPRTELGDWVSSILFAIVAATIVHTYIIQPFVIPSSSLEKTLLVGDFLLVSKLHYGPRAPQTTVAVPMIHDAIPGTTTPSYFKFPQLPKFRLPAFQDIKRNDIVVFNWPVDTLVEINKPYGAVRHKPIDKKTNYVKRCVGLPGDNLSIKDGYVYIDGVKNELPDRAKLQFFNLVETNTPLNQEFIDQYKLTEWGQVKSINTARWNDDKVQNLVRAKGYQFEVIKQDSVKTILLGSAENEFMKIMGMSIESNAVYANMTDDLASAMRTDPYVKEITKQLSSSTTENIFPNTPGYTWNRDNFGPIYIPEAGKTVALTIENLPLYKRAITVYEGNTLKVNGNQISINGDVVDSYTFKQDYYWMMGDNRHNSQDARMWGFVPFDHVVGKPVFVWMSWDTNGKGINKIRWERLFTTVGGEGKLTSYFIPFLVLLGLIFGYNKFKKRKNA